MNSATNLKLDELEGRSFILGRQGHILIASPGASRQHAEISIREGKIYLRDLGSRNGLYLKKDGKQTRFEAGFVSLLQRVSIGDESYLVRDLLTTACQFAFADDHTTMQLPVWKAAAQGE